MDSTGYPPYKSPNERNTIYLNFTNIQVREDKFVHQLYF